jgi:transposase-like protein
MGGHRRKAGGRRVFSTEFKRATVQLALATSADSAHVAELRVPLTQLSWRRKRQALMPTKRLASAISANRFG